MAARRTSDSDSPRRPRRPGTTREAREKQLGLLAVDLAEKQLLDGTASAQVITHYLKVTSTREKLEQEKLRGETFLLKVKRENMEAERVREELYAKAIEAVRSYSGQSVAAPIDEDDEDYYED